MKCGTSTLAAQMGAQAGIFMSTPKEPNYFSDDEIHARGPDWYAALFADAPEGAIRGEASTHYTKLPRYPRTVERMAEALDEVRLVYMIRDPRVRAVSHFVHEWSQGVMPSDPVESFERHPEIAEFGRYAMQLSPFVSRYGRDAVFLTSLEQLKDDPAGELGRICAFVGHDGPVAWREDLAEQNVSANRVRRFPMEGILLNNPVARGLRRSLVPKSVRDRIRESRTMKARPEFSPSQRARLEEIYLEDREALARLFPRHPALDLCYPFARS